MSARELIDDRALEDEDEDDESVDEETGDVRERPNGANNRFEDSSEEDEDDDDEEAAAEVGVFKLEPSPVCSDFVWLPRLRRALSLTKTKKTRKPGLSDDARERSVDEKNASVKMKALTKRISN